MLLVWVLLGALLLMLLVFAGLLRVAARWGRELMELQQFGIEATGTVIEKREYRNRGHINRYIRYEYTDQFGKTHRRKVLVTPDAWDTLSEGGSIALVYSQRKPAISAPKYLVGVMSTPAPQRPF